MDDAVDQREGIRNFLSNLIIRYTLDEALFRKENTFVNKVRSQTARSEICDLSSLHAWFLFVFLD